MTNNRVQRSTQWLTATFDVLTLLRYARYLMGVLAVGLAVTPWRVPPNFDLSTSCLSMNL